LYACANTVANPSGVSVPFDSSKERSTVILLTDTVSLYNLLRKSSEELFGAPYFFFRLATELALHCFDVLIQ